MRRWRSLAAVLLVCSFSASARATQVELSVVGCALRDAELERLVTLELSGVVDPADRHTRYEVQVRCEGGTVAIGLHDPLTRKRVERRVQAPPAEQPEPERVLALTVAQLYRAAWLELASDDAAPLEPASPPASSRAIRAARELSQNSLGSRSEPTFMFGVAAGVRWRHLAAPLALPHAELRLASWAAAPLLLSASAGAELAATERPSGVVNARLYAFSLGAGFELVRQRSWSAFSEMSLGLAHVSLRGSQVAPGYVAAAISKLGLDASVGLGVAYRAGAVRIELASRAGVLSGGPIGLVDPQGDVSLNGPWLGADLRFGLLR